MGGFDPLRSVIRSPLRPVARGYSTRPKTPAPETFTTKVVKKFKGKRK